MSHVLILFQSNTEPVEQLALAVAVGAVEAEGLIRLRRLSTPDAPEVAHKSYGKLQPADLIWADTIVVGLEAPAPNPEELNPLFQLLKAGDLASKRGWTFNPDGPDVPQTEAQLQVNQAFSEVNIAVLPLGEAVISEDLITRMKHCGHLSATK
jgi:hypothetical protein